MLDYLEPMTTRIRPTIDVLLEETIKRGFQAGCVTILCSAGMHEFGKRE